MLQAGRPGNPAAAALPLSAPSVSDKSPMAADWDASTDSAPAQGNAGGKRVLLIGPGPARRSPGYRLIGGLKDFRLRGAGEGWGVLR
jgi:hypothetical protein